jgi:hypothetical protein
VQDHRLIGAEQRAAGDAEDQRIGDLAGGAGDGDTDGGFGHGIAPLWLGALSPGGASGQPARHATLMR